MKEGRDEAGVLLLRGSSSKWFCIDLCPIRISFLCYISVLVVSCSDCFNFA